MNILNQKDQYVKLDDVLLLIQGFKNESIPVDFFDSKNSLAPILEELTDF